MQATTPLVSYLFVNTRTSPAACSLHHRKHAPGPDFQLKSLGFTLPFQAVLAPDTLKKIGSFALQTDHYRLEKVFGTYTRGP